MGNDELQLSGLQGRVTSVKVLEETVPQKVKALTEEAPSSDMNLTEMARWVLHHLINNPRKELDYEGSFSFKPLDYPPVPTGRDPIATDNEVKIDRKFTLMREMCGSREGLEVQEGLHRRILSWVREDGYSWLAPYYCVIEHIKDFDKFTPALSPWFTGRTIMSLAEIYRVTGDIETKKLAKKMVTALRRLANWDNGRAWYERGSTPWRDGEWISTYWETNDQAVLEPVIQYYEISQDQEALDFAVALAEGSIAGLQTTQGPNRIQPDGSFAGHVLQNLYTPLGIAHLGIILHNARYTEWAKRAYDFVYSKSTDYGWVPEVVNFPDSNMGEYGWVPGDVYAFSNSETCCTGIMVAIGSYLAKAGYHNYWDHVERFVRNYMREAQFFVTPEYEALYRSLHKDNPEQADDGIRMMKRIEGGFVGAIKPNDWLYGPNRMNMMGCCTPGGALALYTAWSNVVTESPDGVFINLSFNRETSQAKVVSFLPDVGRLTVLVQKEGNFFLRSPSWAPRSDVKAYRNGKPVETDCKGDYIKFPKVTNREELTITYPLVSFVQKVSIPALGQATFTVKWLGNTVMGIEPKGEYLPLFTHAPRALPEYPEKINF